ncbi:MAG: hypothetical protein LUE64_01980, partial [Candidatus Gastranaerophilales bacterium]|nr:hypothetical protein [Candidatus Gastranaerophilales bacterium]
FVISDIKTYKNVIGTLFDRRKSIFSFYPKKIDEFFNIWTSAQNISKKSEYRKFLVSFFRERKFKELVYDVISFVKCVFGAII